MFARGFEFCPNSKVLVVKVSLSICIVQVHKTGFGSKYGKICSRFLFRIILRDNNYCIYKSRLHYPYMES